MTERTTGYRRPVQVSRYSNYQEHPWRDSREAHQWARAIDCTLDELPDELLALWRRIDRFACDLWAFQAVVEHVPDDSIPRDFAAAAARLADPLISIEDVLRRAGAHLG